jgi:hypothetical protein
LSSCAHSIDLFLGLFNFFSRYDYMAKSLSAKKKKKKRVFACPTYRLRASDAGVYRLSSSLDERRGDFSISSEPAVEMIANAAICK